MKWITDRCAVVECSKKAPKDAELLDEWTELNSTASVDGRVVSITVLVCPQCAKKVLAHQKGEISLVK